MDITQQHIDWWHSLPNVWQEIFIDNLYPEFREFDGTFKNITADLVDIKTYLKKLFELKDIIYTYVRGLEGFDGFGYNCIDEIPDLSFFYQLESINLSDNPIKKLTGIKDNITLKKIYLYYADISDLKQLSRLKNLENLSIPYSNVKDISTIKELKKIVDCDLTKVKADFSVLAELTNLQQLWLEDCHISDINFLSNLSELEQLYLSYNPITDITPILRLKKLKNLEIKGIDSHLSDGQKVELQNMLVNCRILF